LRFYTKKNLNNSELNANHDQYKDVFLEPLDVLTVDNQSRITFTRNIKKILAIHPDDKIIVYQNRYNNKNMIFKIQRGGSIVNSWILTQSGINNDFNHKKETLAIIKDKNANKSNEGAKDATLYQTPILLVDDEKDLLNAFELLLKKGGYTNVKAFSDSKEVLKCFTDISKFKLAILDIRMPDINGIQLYNIIKILNPSIKILFMTALDAVDELTSMMIDISSQDIMRKPLSTSHFIEKVTDKIKMS
jgi:CheY-like chemotaxis protein